MAKTSKPAKNTPVATPKTVAEPVGPRFLRADPVSEHDPFLKKIFWGTALAALVLMAVASFGVGVNADDKFQVDYSEKLVNYYGTMGRDTSALFIKEGNMHLYGGFFDTFTGFANKALGQTRNDLGYHNLRHFFTAILGWVAILFAGLFAARLAGWRAGIIAVALGFLAPRFFGDSLMNPKDIPFAAGYMMALFFMVKSLDALPRPGWKNLLGLAAGIAIALATRAGGLLLFAYLGMFGGLHLLMKNGGFSAIFSEKIVPYLKFILPAALGGYFLACLFWPFALQNPLKNPLAALAKFADLEVHIRVLFGGENIMSDKTPRGYVFQWIWRTLPLGVLFGLVGYLFFLPKLWKKYQPLWVVLAGFAAVFPVFYVIYKHSVLHDGWRHLTFAFLPMVVCAALFWNELMSLFSKNKMATYAVAGVLGLLTIDSAGYILQNPHLSYTYFNPISGGISGNYGKFETDYWGISTRQGIEWLEKQGILNDHMTQPVTIATNMHFSAKMLVGKYGDKVKMRYLKWEKRCDEPWDYALYPTRFLDGSQIRQPEGFPPKNTAHLVEAGGVPILAVLKNDGSDCAEGMAAAKTGNWPATIAALQKEVVKVPNNELAWANLAQALLNTKSFDSATVAARRTLQIAPDYQQATNILGLVLLQKGQTAEARAHFEAAARRDPSNAAAWYYTAFIMVQSNELDGALKILQKCIDQAPNFRPALELAVQIYQQQGNTAAAQRLMQSLK